MDQDFIRFGLAAFVTLLVIVDPPGIVPIFVALTKDEPPSRRRKIPIRAVLIDSEWRSSSCSQVARCSPTLV
ncbi:MAG: MarC family protein [Pyrinomonadaceae bacterium]